MWARACVSDGLPVPPQDKEKKKKESILDLSKYIDKTIRVKFQGGREGEGGRLRGAGGGRSPGPPVSRGVPGVSLPTASGVLKGFDPLLNLVLDGTVEYMRGASLSLPSPFPFGGGGCVSRVLSGVWAVSLQTFQDPAG